MSENDSVATEVIWGSLSLIMCLPGMWGHIVVVHQNSEVWNLCPEKVCYSPVSAAWALVTTRFYYFNAFPTQLPAVLLSRASRLFEMQLPASLLKSATVSVLLLHWQIALRLSLCFFLQTLLDMLRVFVFLWALYFEICIPAISEQ